MWNDGERQGKAEEAKRELGRGGRRGEREWAEACA